MSGRTYGERIDQVRSANRGMVRRLAKITLFIVLAVVCWLGLGGVAHLTGLFGWLLPVVLLGGFVVFSFLLFAWIMVVVHVGWTALLHRRFNTNRYPNQSLDGN